MWVFAYGSLMWNPGFEFEERTPARAHGYRRCFCLQSIQHRGTEEQSGLVLGLDRGGVCDGIAFRIHPEQEHETRQYLWSREQGNGVYREMRIPIDVYQDGSWHAETALAYVVEREHPSYTGDHSIARQARLISRSRGKSGFNLDYLINTREHLAELGLRERDFELLVTAIGPFFFRQQQRKKQIRGGEQPRSSVKTLFDISRNRPTRARQMKKDLRRRFMYRRFLGGH